MHLKRKGSLALLLSISVLYCLGATLLVMGPLLWLALAIATSLSLISTFWLRSTSALLMAVSYAVAVLTAVRLLVFITLEQ